MDELKSIREILEKGAACDPKLTAQFQQCRQEVAQDKNADRKKPPQAEPAGTDEEQKAR